MANFVLVDKPRVCRLISGRRGTFPSIPCGAKDLHQRGFSLETSDGYEFPCASTEGRYSPASLPTNAFGKLDGLLESNLSPFNLAPRLLLFSEPLVRPFLVYLFLLDLSIRRLPIPTV